jgi:FlaA1/EpsC-like NDP-sugar epimerase
MIVFRIVVKIIYIEMNNPRSERSNTVIFGDEELAVITKRTIDRDIKSKQNVCAFISNNNKKVKQKLEGTYIYGIDDFENLVKKYNVKNLIFAQKNLKPELKNQLTETALNYNINVKTVPEINEWINGELSISQLKNVKIEDLLERPEINLSKEKIKQQISGKTVLITGAAGSIGSEIVRQVSKFKPAIIVLFDQAESPMYDIELELQDEFKFTDYKVVIGDISNKNRVEYIINRYKPQIIFHAAAYKHVPMMEKNPYEAVKTNIEGTKILAETAHKTGVERFVMISTDKAVNPTNVMGASKRIAEMFVQSLDKQSKTKFITTRFGNVLGSNGSVIPRFRKQIENGGPITVTHPEITRYFMTIPEACQLVLEAGTTGKGGEIFIFDMGKSVKIIDLAKKMIKLSGLELGKDIQIQFTGLRPGEKLYEELLNNQENSTLLKKDPKGITVTEIRHLKKKIQQDSYINADIAEKIDLFLKEV